jgi:LPS-assembly protein
MNDLLKTNGAWRTVTMFALLLCCGTLLDAAAQPAQGSPAASSTPSLPTGPDATARLEANQQRKEGDTFFADGDVQIEYRNLRLRADHVTYNSRTYSAEARGRVQFDMGNQHLSADSGQFNVRSGEGHFEHVKGEVRVQHRANAALLVSPNPLVFEAQEVRRVDDRTYIIEHAWLTVCEPTEPSWKFFASRATIHVDKSVAMVNANFRLFRVPLIYTPYANAPAGRNLRQSGFLLPEISDTTLKGVVLGDAYYWAPRDWADATLGAAYLSRRGWQENAEVRAKPWENVSLSAQYFGVFDRGLLAPVVTSSGSTVQQLVKQGGHSAQFELDARLQGGWRAVADLNQLSSLIFQLAFAPTFGEAVNSEVRSTAFLTKSFGGISVGLATQSYKNFLNAQPQVAVDLRNAPEIRVSSTDQSPWRKLPIYFGVDAFSGAVHRSDEFLAGATVVPGIDTPGAVDRSELAPRAVLPLRIGPWLGATTSYTLRTTSYGAQLAGGGVVNDPVQRTTGELEVDLRPPTLERVWQRPGGKWKHAIEPEIVYSYVRGVNQFDRFIRFDEDETLTDTNEVMYSVTQRLFHRSGENQSTELMSWRVAQKYYFDPTFNGALVPGTRNVFQALDSITPFAFADQPRHFSPIDSDLRIVPNAAYDGEIRLDYDTVRHKLTTVGTLLKINPYQQFNLTLAHFAVDNTAILQPLANQIRAQVGYGSLNRRGWNGSVGFSYDAKQEVMQNQLIQISYNGSCCGIAFEYRRLALGPIRTENQFRVAFIIANIGTFGNLRRQDKLF